ncbi:ABC-2 type transport system ATP-binding protein [Desulfovibrionales bacterium]
MLEVRNINYHYGCIQVLYNLSFSVTQGEILGLLGPNGAGKSTTMRILTGYLTPSTGQVLFSGKNIQEDIIGLRHQLGYMPENVPLYSELTVTEYLDWAARIKQSSDPNRQVAEAIERCGLKEVRYKLIRYLSKGYQQRTNLAQAILGHTRLLILDEPTVGLDPAQIREIRSLIKELGRDMTILLSTHILPEVELTCDRVCIINKGRIVAKDTPNRLVHAFGGKSRYLLRLELPSDSPTAEQAVLDRYATIPGVLAVERVGYPYSAGSFFLKTDPTVDQRADLTRLAFESGWPIIEFKPADQSLEDAFIHLVHEENQAAGNDFTSTTAATAKAI